MNRRRVLGYELHISRPTGWSHPYRHSGAVAPDHAAEAQALVVSRFSILATTAPHEPAQAALAAFVAAGAALLAHRLSLPGLGPAEDLQRPHQPRRPACSRRASLRHYPEH